MIGETERWQELASKIWELRKAGFSVPHIASTLGIGKDSVRRCIDNQLDQLRRYQFRSAEQYRDLELARLEQIGMSIWPDVTAGNLRAIDRYLKVVDKRIELLGLKSPVEITGKDGAPLIPGPANAAEAAQLLERIGAMNLLPPVMAKRLNSGRDNQ